MERSLDDGKITIHHFLARNYLKVSALACLVNLELSYLMVKTILFLHL